VGDVYSVHVSLFIRWHDSAGFGHVLNETGRSVKIVLHIYSCVTRYSEEKKQSETLVFAFGLSATLTLKTLNLLPPLSTRRYFSLNRSLTETYKGI
jgi:hypothetical protein